jgi:hypothetical protein
MILDYFVIVFGITAIASALHQKLLDYFINKIGITPNTKTI